MRTTISNVITVEDPTPELKQYEKDSEKPERRINHMTI